MSDDTKDQEVSTSPRQRRRTRRAKHRRGLRVPIDDVPRRSIADDSLPPPPERPESLVAPALPEDQRTEIAAHDEDPYEGPTDVTDIPSARPDEIERIRSDLSPSDSEAFRSETFADGAEATDVTVTVPDGGAEPDDVDAEPPTRPSARVVVRGTVRVSDVPPALIASEFAVDEPTSDDDPEVHIEVDQPEADEEGDDVGDVDLVGRGAEWGSDEGDLLWREEQSRELRILEPTQDEAAQIAAAVEDEGVEVEVSAEESATSSEVITGGSAAAPALPPPPPASSGVLPPAPPVAETVDVADPAPKAKRRRPWFETFFNDDYLRTVPPPPEAHVRRQCDFIERSLGLERGATILDVGCGLGLHAVELSARGYLVVGLDLSLPMLSRAADEAQDRGLKINFLHGDMREMTFDGAFDAVLCWGTTLGYFDDELNKRVIERFYQALRPGGMLLIDVVNRDYVVRSQPNLVWFEGDGCVCMEETQYNFIKARLEVKRTVILDDGRQRENYYSIRLYAFHELGQLLHQQGFRVGSVSGHEAIPGVFFGADSPRMLVLAARRRDFPGRSPSFRNLNASGPDTPPPPPPEGPMPPAPPKDAVRGPAGVSVDSSDEPDADSDEPDAEEEP